MEESISPTGKTPRLNDPMLQYNNRYAVFGFYMMETIGKNHGIIECHPIGVVA
ncbi:hypothetical protein [Prolixibacter sp. NT017]|uniref:hypothetical protein n=1 Tax=Prolixibacter sp. NT017 TaxID=2652390 RepID=UPI00129949C1|nr:hypothetical protein [Prolixibacter sp. NT017]